MTLPIGGADMPVVISLYNALTGLAVAFEGFVLQNAAMIIAGTVVGAAGTLLTQLMAKAMNRSLANVLFSRFGDEVGEASDIAGSMKPIEAPDVGVMMAFADKVLIVPGYGMAVVKRNDDRHVGAADRQCHRDAEYQGEQEEHEDEIYVAMLEDDNASKTDRRCQQHEVEKLLAAEANSALH